jgi:polygalacturonase
MSNQQLCLKSFAERHGSLPSRLVTLMLVSPLGLLACGSDGADITPYSYECGTDPGIAFEAMKDNPPEARCGYGDPELPPEPSYDAIPVCRTLYSNKSTPDESDLDTDRVQAALTECKGGKGAVKLVADGSNNAFITSHLGVFNVILWVDKGVTLYASRNPDLYQGPLGNCGTIGTNDSSACQDFISINDAYPGIIGEGTIDGQGGEPLVGRDYSWWEASSALRGIDGSIGNPTLINALSNTSHFLLYGITLIDSPKFHVKISSAPARGVSNPPCTAPGEGFTVWGVTIQTPSKWVNSQGRLMSPQWARNTDGIDPGANSVCSCGVIACSTITTGDDHIAIKGGHYVGDLVIAHNHLGTGHGMSIGSETMGDAVDDNTGARLPAINNVHIYDLTIDADSRWVGKDASPNDFNGIRIKSDPSRGGAVANVHYNDICMRDMSNSLLISTSYNPLFSGIPKYMPKFGALDFHDIRGVTCMSETQTIVSINGYSVNNITGPVQLDNVIFDNIGPQSTSAKFADITMGPGNVNFDIGGLGASVSKDITDPQRPPKKCVFPTLPAPKKPEGWVW